MGPSELSQPKVCVHSSDSQTVQETAHERGNESVYSNLWARLFQWSTRIVWERPLALAIALSVTCTCSSCCCRCRCRHCCCCCHGCCFERNTILVPTECMMDDGWSLDGLNSSSRRKTDCHICTTPGLTLSKRYCNCLSLSADTIVPC